MNHPQLDSLISGFLENPTEEDRLLIINDWLEENNDLRLRRSRNLLEMRKQLKTIELHKVTATPFYDRAYEVPAIKLVVAPLRRLFLCNLARLVPVDCRVMVSDFSEGRAGQRTHIITKTLSGWEAVKCDAYRTCIVAGELMWAQLITPARMGVAADVAFKMWEGSIQQTVPALRDHHRNDVYSIVRKLAISCARYNYAEAELINLTRLYLGDNRARLPTYPLMETNPPLVTNFNLVKEVNRLYRSGIIWG